MVECHMEQTGIIKKVPMAMSLTSIAGNDHYEGVHPITMVKKHYRRLVVETFACDALVTSCIRMDITSNSSVSAGADTLKH